MRCKRGRQLQRDRLDHTQPAEDPLRARLPMRTQLVPTGISLRMDRLTHIPTAATDPRR